MSLHLNDLNLPQKEAVEHIFGPLLILAGAGSGKTRVLTHRIAHIIAQGEASPHEILAVTFTNKAAREMESRTVALLNRLGIPVMGQLWISTFHSIAARILREHIYLLGYQPFFVIYDDSDQLSMIKKILIKLNIDEKAYPAKSFKVKINEAKTLGLTPDKVLSKASYLMDDKAQNVYAVYEEEMKRANALDFSDLLLKTYLLFKTHPEVLDIYQRKFKFIMVDEYQDTNHIQYLLVKMLAQHQRNLCVVGDEDQSIYSWRGADIRNILDFEKDFDESHVIKLEKNYRSTRNIVEAASELIKNNSQRKEKVLFTENDMGSPIVIAGSESDYEEARSVVQKIESLRSRHPSYDYKDFAIFYRTNAQSRVLEDQLRSHKIPYKLIGGTKFYDRMEVKDILSYLKLILNPSDDIAFKRIINKPARGIGKTSVETIEQTSIQLDIPLYNACETVVDQRRLHAGACQKIRKFKNLIESFKEQSTHLKLSELYHVILDGSEYVAKLRGENTVESKARIENLEELNNAIMQFEEERGEEANLTSFLEEMALVSDADQVSETDDAVTLMTLHVSKGLEYPNVFIVGMEEGLFPSIRSSEGNDSTELEEERRLAYVGMTRAKENLFLTYALSRRVWGQIHQHTRSRFINEIPKKYLKFEGEYTPSFLKNTYGSYNSSHPTENRNRYRQLVHEESFDSMPNYEDFDENPSFTIAPQKTTHRSKDSHKAPYKKGMLVRHPSFGAGTIYSIEGSGETQRVSIVFQNQTFKKFVVKHARLEIIG